MAYATVPSAAAQIFIASTSDATTTSSPVDTTGADLLVAVLSWSVAGSTEGEPVVTDSYGNTWNTLTTCIGHSSGLQSRLVYCENAVVGTGHTFTLTVTLGTLRAVTFSVQGFSGSNASPFDVQNQFGTDSAILSMQAGAVTPSLDDSLIVFGHVSGGTSTFTVDEGFAITFQQAAGADYGSVLAYLIQGTAATVNPTVSFTAKELDENCAMIAVFKPTGGGPPPGPSGGNRAFPVSIGLRSFPLQDGRSYPLA